MNDMTPSEAPSISQQASNADLNCPPEILLKKLEQLGKVLGIEASELLFWMGKYLSLQTTTLLSFIHLAIAHRLDPLIGEVALWFDAEQQAHPSITIDGWMKIINAHPAFTGIEFEQTTAAENTAPQSMQCTIYRSDRTTPIRVQEYFDEVKSDHPMWKSMPRRMLRHRALQQCARLAFGISTPEFLTTECAPSNGFNRPKAPSANLAVRDFRSDQGEHLTEKPRCTQKVSRTEQLKTKLFNSSPQSLT